MKYLKTYEEEVNGLYSVGTKVVCLRDTHKKGIFHKKEPNSPFGFRAARYNKPYTLKKDQIYTISDIYFSKDLGKNFYKLDETGEHNWNRSLFRKATPDEIIGDDAKKYNL